MAWFQSRQQKLAVEMWEYIKKTLQKNSARLIQDLKENFAETHGLEYRSDSKCERKWVHNCWLCENAQQNCCDCLLRTCKEGASTYGTVVNMYASKQERLNACDTIIKAIKDTDHYYVLEDNRLTTVPGNRKTTFEGTLKACLAFVDCMKGLEEDEV